MPKRGQNKSRKIAVQDSVQVNLSRNWKATRKQMGKHYLSIFQRNLLPTRFMLELQKLLIEYSKKRGASSIGEFPFFNTCSSLYGNYG